MSAVPTEPDAAHRATPLQDTLPATAQTPAMPPGAAAAPDTSVPKPGPTPAPGSRVALAIAALEASRGLLRHEMLPPPATPAARAHGKGAPRWLRAPRRWLSRWLRRWPAAELATEAVQGWWHSHPLRPVGDLLTAQWRQIAAPAVRRHPVLTVAAAAALGALVVSGRPWRWPLVARELQPLPSRAGHWLVAQLSSVPVQTALAALAVMAAQPPTPPKTTPSPQPDSDPTVSDFGDAAELRAAAFDPGRP